MIHQTNTFLNRVLLGKVAGAIALSALYACGGGSSGAEGGGGGSTAGGEQAPGAITTEGGTTLSQEAQTRWADALTAYNTASADGFTAEECGAVIAGFERANSSQGGRFTEAIYMIGVTHDRCGHAEQARDHYRRTLEANQRFCGARVAEGLDHFRNGRTAQARAEFERSIRDDARCTEGYVNLAIMQRREGTEASTRDSLNNLRRALAIDSGYLPAFNQMALLYLGQAIRRAGGAQGVAGGTAQLSGAAQEQGEQPARRESSDRQMLDLAEVVCRQAQLINGSYAPIFNTWGLINVRQGNIIAGLAKFERAFALDPNLFEAYMNFGELTLSFRGYEDAARAFERATQLQATNYDAWIGLGAAQRGLNNDQAAQQSYERAQQLDANRPESYFNLGLLHQDYRDGTEATLNQASQFYQQFLQRAGSRPEYAPAVEVVNRRCATDARAQRRRRWQRTACQMGRLQQIENSITLMREAAQMQAEMERIQAQAAAQEAAQPPATPADAAPPSGEAPPPAADSQPAPP
jgi:tetratricopeptide (TPR) repeat protein